MVTNIFCFAIRKSLDNGKDWIDINTWGYVKDTSKEKAEIINNEIPGWSKSNPVVRISFVCIEEI